MEVSGLFTEGEKQAGLRSLCGAIQRQNSDKNFRTDSETKTERERKRERKRERERERERESHLRVVVFIV